MQQNATQRLCGIFVIMYMSFISLIKDLCMCLFVVVIAIATALRS